MMVLSGVAFLRQRIIFMGLWLIKKCDILGVAEESSLLGCDNVSMGK
jgi:hypothetical protein